VPFKFKINQINYKILLIKMSSQGGSMPGYTGFKPTADNYGPNNVQRDAGAHIPGMNYYII
jgi:hypothetical protein